MSQSSPRSSKPKHRVYVESEKRWMSIKEAVQRLNHPELFVAEKEQDPAHAEFQRVVDVIVEFLERSAAERSDGKCRPVAAPSCEGHYEGLPEVLDWEGLTPQDVTINHINAAWRAYRRLHPFPAWHDKIDVRVVVTGEGEVVDSSKREKLFGFPVSAVIRWMGKDDWDREEAKKALSAYKLEVAEVTIIAQLRAGKTGERGPPADLSSYQMSELWKVIT